MPTPVRRSLLINAEALSNHVSRPLFRDEHVRELVRCFTGGVADARPLHAWLHGPPGTGKTLCIRHVLETASGDKGVVPVYVNCRERFTFFAVVDAILDVVKPLRSPYRSRDVQLAILRAELKGKRFVIALDDADVLPRRDLSDLLYQVAPLSHVSVLCVAASRRALLELPPEVLSRFSPRQIVFSRFSPDQIREIVSDAAARALAKDAWTSSLVEAICQHAYGDARRALALLRHAVQHAEDEHALRVEARHLTAASTLPFDARTEADLALLSFHHRLVFDIVAARGRVFAADLESEYRRRCDSSGIPPVATRTFSNYLSELCQRHLLGRERGAGASGWTYFLPPDRDHVSRNEGT